MLKRVVIIGPESTGKSTLSADLAAYFGEPWVPEYAREYLNQRNGSYDYDDLLKIAEGQVISEDTLAASARNFLFCDTDLHVIKVWSEHKYGKVDPWITQQLKSRHYDAYILTGVDMPWEADPLREHPDPSMRAYFYGVYQQLLEDRGLPLLAVSGSSVARLEAAAAWLERQQSW
ncbi:Ribosylnicotinamide kinase [Lunatimonas lonarensis]|uniref:Ribosylnicotinamide kinase n=1 Tax=Lunatimonas lonarensis TaxID=1232681 RepID=R7ZT02_9BACT|nr:ATP-binding protein [Lunatimonas lonarensis]EON77265.1 Ribosylnicotinamide kinase [Lunatimonas lonarensis]